MIVQVPHVGLAPPGVKNPQPLHGCFGSGETLA